MKVIVGLGNHEEKYLNTRHNLGFLVLDQLLEKLEPLNKTFWDSKKNLKADIKQVKFKDNTLLLAKPTTFMNNSGWAVSKILSFYKVSPEDLIVIQDELDIPFGKIRVRFGGGAGGHHGVESIIEHLGTDKFLRIRLGIGQSSKTSILRDKGEVVSDYVLSTFSPHEKGKLRTLIKEAIKNTEQILEHGIDVYMSKYNKKV